MIWKNNDFKLRVQVLCFFLTILTMLADIGLVKAISREDCQVNKNPLYVDHELEKCCSCMKCGKAILNYSDISLDCVYFHNLYGSDRLCVTDNRSLCCTVEEVRLTGCAIQNVSTEFTPVQPTGATYVFKDFERGQSNITFFLIGGLALVVVCSLILYVACFFKSKRHNRGSLHEESGDAELIWSKSDLESIASMDSVEVQHEFQSAIPSSENKGTSDRLDGDAPQQLLSSLRNDSSPEPEDVYDFQSSSETLRILSDRNSCSEIGFNHLSNTNSEAKSPLIAHPESSLANSDSTLSTPFGSVCWRSSMGPCGCEETHVKEVLSREDQAPLLLEHQVNESTPLGFTSSQRGNTAYVDSSSSDSESEISH